MNIEKPRIAFRLNLGKIITRIGLMIALFLVILTVYTIGIYLQNSKVQRVIYRVEQVRIPVRAAVNDILVGTNRLATSQRGYFMSGDAKYKQERQELWQQSIVEPLKRLEGFKEHLSAVDQTNLEQAATKLHEYKKVQDELEQYYDQTILPVRERLQPLLTTDSIAVGAFTNDLVLKARLDQEMHDLISLKSRKLRKEYQDLLQIIKDTQEDELHLDTEQINREILVTNGAVIATLMIATIAWIILGYYISRSLKKSIQKPVNMLQRLQSGDLPEAVEESGDELNAIIQAGNQMVENLRNASLFARYIGEGKFDHSFQASSVQDVLGNSLLQMRDKLQQVSREDQKRNWITRGLAELGDIIRTIDNTSAEFYPAIVSFVVNYLKANQGALFITNQKMLEMAACYAYNRRKFQTKTIQPGEGLVGQAYLEKEPIFLKQVPEEYLRITSGLGDAPPRSILVCPLVMKDEVYGVLELASFTVFEEYQIELIEKISEQLAAVIAAAQVSQRTVRLLQDSQQQGEELRAQEEEMRQNMEELAATQEEMFRKEQEYVTRIRELEEKLAAITLNV